MDLQMFDDTPMVYVALWHHRHGVDVFLFNNAVDESEVVQTIVESGGEWEGNEREDEWIEICPGPLPIHNVPHPITRVVKA